MPRILLVDDDLQGLASTRRLLELEGYQVETTQDGEAALEMIRKVITKQVVPFDVILSDVRMPKMSGIDFLRAMKFAGENTPFVLMTAYGRVEDAVWAMKLGAVDFLTKPFRRNTLLEMLAQAVKRGSAKEEAQKLAPQSEARYIVGRSRVSLEMDKLLDRVAPTLANVLILGESGTGKEWIARELVRRSPRAQKPFLAINCAAIPETLLEPELFGHERGAFTGAHQSKRGLFEQADQGTLLLDEIGDLSLPLQVKLLRVLQEGEVRRVGGTESRNVNVRILAATNLNLRERVAEGKFREDLFHRLEVIAVNVSPLRERSEDLDLFVEYFLEKFAYKHKKSKLQFTPEANAAFYKYMWPGNIRELGNVIERAVVLGDDTTLGMSLLPQHIQQAQGQHITESHLMNSRGSIEIPLGVSLKDVEELLIRKTLEATSGDKAMTAKLLGIHSRTIHRRLEKKPESSQNE